MGVYIFLLNCAVRAAAGTSGGSVFVWCSSGPERGTVGEEEPAMCTAQAAIPSAQQQAKTGLMAQYLKPLDIFFFSFF